jgi:hypothetical protein
VTPRRVGDRAPIFEHKSIKNTRKEREQQGENSMGGRKREEKGRNNEPINHSLKSTFGDR